MTTTHWRTLIAVTGIDGTDAIARVPGWNPHEPVRIPLEKFPDHLRPKEGIEQDQYVIAKVRLGADRGEDLDPVDFEKAPGPDPNDGLA